MIQTCVFLCDWLCRELAGLLLLTSGLIFQQILLHQKETNAPSEQKQIQYYEGEIKSASE